LFAQLVLFKGQSANAIRHAVDELLRLPSVLYYLRAYSQKQINAFATYVPPDPPLLTSEADKKPSHASRYFELYCPSGSIEITHTSRYSQFTGKSELCILATRAMSVGAVITELKGSMADLTDEEDKELKRTDRRNTDGGIRRDFSVIHSRQMKKNHLFLGPARFVNVSTEHSHEANSVMWRRTVVGTSRN
jgi:[histone H4]-N-methyl-L-lysine20 N-methyltransferase